MIIRYGRPSKLKQSPYAFLVRESTVSLSVTNNIFIEFPTFSHLLFVINFLRRSNPSPYRPISLKIKEILKCAHKLLLEINQGLEIMKNVGDNEEIRDSSL